MTSRLDLSMGNEEPGQPSAATARGLALLGLVPMLGVLVFAGAALLGLRAFSHNHALSCLGDMPGSSDCSHYSYAGPVVLGIVGILLVMGGGALASYYAMKNVGLPLMAALRRRDRVR